MTRSTGDPYLCAPWSFAGMPSIALPSGLAPDGLPLSLQLVGGALGEAPLGGRAARRISAGSLSPVDLVTECLAQIERTEAPVSRA